MLTDSQCRTVTCKDKLYKLTDAKGLYLEAKPNGVKAWRYRLKLTKAGKPAESIFAIGEYSYAPPGETKEQAKARRDGDRAIAPCTRWLPVQLICATKPSNAGTGCACAVKTKAKKERSMTVNPFRGTWRIVSMEGWDQDYVDMEVPAYIAFEKNNLGEFQFGLVQGQTDYRINDKRVEFTWSGVDENDGVSGRGFAEIAQGELLGHIYIHSGDDSAFRAVKQ